MMHKFKRNLVNSSLSLLVMLLGGGFIYRRLIFGWCLAGGDLQTYFYPYWAAVTRFVQAGELPLWNPNLFAGAPLLANSQAGVFYPLNWIFWLLSGPAPEMMTRLLHVNVLVHLLLAACTAYVLARRLGASAWGGAVCGLIYAGGGFLGVHLEHLNQLQGMAWLPLVLLPTVTATQAPFSMPRPSPLNVLALALVLLAGHTQTAFIAVVAIIVWYVTLVVLCILQRRGVREKNPETQARDAGKNPVRLVLFRVLRALLSLFPFGLAGLIAAVQLLPTYQLSHYSMRSGGLPWREAVSFSVPPWQLAQVLLPPYIVSPLLPEGVAYIGLMAFSLAGLAVWHILRKSIAQSARIYTLGLIVLGGCGLFLALGGYNPLYLAAVRAHLPGFVHFRAPARFLVLYTLSVSVLAGLGFSALHRFMLGELVSCSRGPGKHRVIRAFMACLVIVVATAVELLICAEYLPHARATTSRAYTDLRPATSHLVAATRSEVDARIPPGRFLSVSKTLFDPGDKTEIEIIYDPFISPSGFKSEALWTYFVSTKQREVLAPNLSMAFDVPALDGYDGGLLPLRHYVAFSRLLLPGGTLDGRLRENLTVIPEGRWLSLAGVRFVITDKTGDAWADGIFYDQQFQPQLSAGDALDLAWLPTDFEATALGLLAQGQGKVSVTLDDGRVLALPISGDTDGLVPLRLSWDIPAIIRTLSIQASTPLTLSGASLIDERTDAFYPLVVSDRFHLVHSGDVKIYENLQLLPRVFFVKRGRCMADEASALLQMAESSFDPAQEVILHDCATEGLQGEIEYGNRGESSVHLVTYTPTEVVVNVSTTDTGFLVLSDAWYPGWQAEVQAQDGTCSTQATVLRADLLFRAISVDPGEWRIVLRYEAPLIYVGFMMSALGCIAFWFYLHFQGQFWRNLTKRFTKH